MAGENKDDTDGAEMAPAAIAAVEVVIVVMHEIRREEKKRPATTRNEDELEEATVGRTPDGLGAPRGLCPTHADEERRAVAMKLRRRRGRKKTGARRGEVGSFGGRKRKKGGNEKGRARVPPSRTKLQVHVRVKQSFPIETAHALELPFVLMTAAVLATRASKSNPRGRAHERTRTHARAFPQPCRAGSHGTSGDHPRNNRTRALDAAKRCVRAFAKESGDATPRPLRSLFARAPLFRVPNAAARRVSDASCQKRPRGHVSPARGSLARRLGSGEEEHASFVCPRNPAARPIAGPADLRCAAPRAPPQRALGGREARRPAGDSSSVRRPRAPSRGLPVRIAGRREAYAQVT